MILWFFLLVTIYGSTIECSYYEFNDDLYIWLGKMDPSIVSYFKSSYSAMLFSRLFNLILYQVLNLLRGAPDPVESLALFLCTTVSLLRLFLSTLLISLSNLYSSIFFWISLLILSCSLFLIGEASPTFSSSSVSYITTLIFFWSFDVMKLLLGLEDYLVWVS